MQPSSSFEIDSHLKGYHAYLDNWKPCRGEVLQAIPEPKNAVDKYAVCVLKDGEVVGHSGMALGFFILGPGTHISDQIGVPSIFCGSQSSPQKIALEKKSSK